MNLIEHFKIDFLKKYEDEEKKKFHNVISLIDDFSETSLFHDYYKFDLFKTLRLHFNENQLSDVIASTFRLPFGKDILLLLLDKHKHVRSEIQNVFEIIQHIDLSDIYIIREDAGDDSRIDIRVYSKTVSYERFVIDFELKVSNGSETIKNGEWQTDREWQDLNTFSRNNHIAEESMVAFFISNDGSPAKNSNFTPISRKILNQLICEVLEKNIYTQYAEIDSFGINTLCHLFKSNWIN
jgi:hypothetical protein